MQKKVHAIWEIEYGMIQRKSLRTLQYLNTSYPASLVVQ